MKKSQLLAAGAILIGFLVIGGILLFSFSKQAKAVTEDEVNTVIPNPTPILPEQCGTGRARDNNGNCVLIQCPHGQIRQSGGSCVLEEFAQQDPQAPAECVPSGYIKSAYIRTKGNVNEMVENPLGSYPSVSTIQFQVTSSCKARYYFESGLRRETFTILQSAGSKCDGNNHYAGRFITMDKNTIVNEGGNAGLVDIAFYPIDYGNDETLTVVAGAYTGCGKDGGKIIDDATGRINYNKGLNKWSASDITKSWVKVK